MCNCVKQIDKNLSEKNTKLEVIFTLGKVSKEYPRIATTKVDTKVKIGPVAMIPSYCPFCGKKYE